MSIALNFALQMDKTLLKWHSAVVMSAVGVVTSPGVLDEVVASGEADAFGFYLLWSYLVRMRRWIARRTAGRAL
jgi:hypothetical protein